MVICGGGYARLCCAVVRPAIPKEPKFKSGLRDEVVA